MRDASLVDERRGRLAEAGAAGFLRDVGRSPDGATVLALSRRHRPTVHGAACLEPARREGLPLATLDDALRAAASASGVPLLGG